MTPPRSTSLVTLIAIIVVLALASRVAHGAVSQSTAYTHLLKWEGYSTRPYRDAGGWSVGLGHSLSTHAEPVNTTYTAAQVQAFFERDFAVSLQACRAGVKGFDNLPADVQLVALSVVWTTGPTGFSRFTGFRRALERRAYTTACLELATSKWATQVRAARRNAALRVLASH